jgi:hypothetical protein
MPAQFRRRRQASRLVRMLVQFDFACGSGVSMHLLNRVRVVV